jgi:phage tail tube protein FII
MNVYIMEAVNLICGDTGTEQAPGKSTHLTISELKLPGFEENYIDHQPGGAPVSIEVPTHFNRLEATFNLNGWQPEVMGLLAQSDVLMQRFTAYGLIRDRRTGAALRAVGVMWGRLGRVNPTAFSRGNMQSHEFSIRSIIHYELSMQLAPNSEPVPIYKWDFFSMDFKVYVNGEETNVNRDLINVLAIPGASA